MKSLTCAFTILLSIIGIATSCKKFVQIPPATNLIANEGVFMDSANATAALLGVYIDQLNAEYISGPLTGRLSLLSALSADEFVPSNPTSTESSYFQNSVEPSAEDVYWERFYVAIYQVNAVIEGVTRSKLQVHVKDRLIGEATFLRAWFYYHLVNLFGPCPLITTTNYQQNVGIGRTSVDSIYKSITEDLLFSEKLLSETYITAGRARPNKFTASILLAKVYLTREMWKEASDKAQEIINSPQYSLEMDLNKVFVSSSKEIIWQLQPIRPGIGNPEANSYIPSGNDVKPSFFVSRSLLDAFEINDKRKEVWLRKNTIQESGSGVDYYYPFKYKISCATSTPSPESIVVFRLSDVLLIHAESKSHLDNFSGPNSAEADVNAIRNRAGLLSVTPSSQEEALTIIANERRVELFSEWGSRWYDLKRTKMIDKVMGAEASNKGSAWNSSAQLLPIPFDQIKVNVYLKQNPGYN